MVIYEWDYFIRSSGQYGAVVNVLFIHVEWYKVDEELHTVKLDVWIVRFQYFAYQKG